MLASQENASNNLTAQITLVLYLMDRDTTDMSRQEMEEPFNICRQLIESSPGYWQSELAKLYLVFEPSYTGDTNQQLLLIQDALSAVDFDLLDKTDNEVLNAMKQIYTQGEDSSWKDVLLVIRANALCEEDRLIEAEEVVKSITSEKHRKLMQDRVALGKKMRAQRNKIDPSPK